MPENIVWDKEINPDALDAGNVQWDKEINPAAKGVTGLMVPITDNQVIRAADKPGRFGQFTKDIDDFLESNKVTSGVYGDIKDFFTKSKEEDVADAGIRLQIAQETGIPMKHIDKEVIRNYAEAQGAYTQPTNKQVVGGLMTAAFAIPGAQIVAAPLWTTKAAIALKTAIGVGSFAAVEEGINYLASNLKDKEYRFGAGESFAPEESSQTVKDLFYVGELIAGGVAAGKAIGGAKWGAEKIKENFLRETVETYNMPRTIYISPEKIREFHGLGREDVISPMETEVLKDAKIPRQVYVSALKNGIDIELPVERIVTIADKPWVKGLKDWFRMAPYEKTTAEFAGEVKKPVAGLLEEKGGLAGETVPPLKVDVEGKAIQGEVGKVEPTANMEAEKPVIEQKKVESAVIDENLPQESTITRGEEDDVNTLLTLAAKQDQFQGGTMENPPEYDAIRQEASRLALESINKQMAMEARKYSAELKKQGLEMAKADPTFIAMEGIVKSGGIKHSTLTKLYDSYTIKEIARKRPGLVSKTGTMGADEFAQEYGFENDEALIQAILKWEGVKAVGEKMASDFEKSYLNFISEGEGIDFHIKFLEEEQKILAKLMKANAPKPATGLKKVIREQSGQISVDDIMVKSSDALRAGLKKSEQAARKAYKEGKLEGVMKEKERQIELALNLKYRIADREAVNKMHSEIGKIVKDTNLPEYYRDAIQNYLADYDLLPRSSKGMREVESTRQFIDRMEAEGETVDIPRAMMDKIERYGKTHWRELSVDQLTEIYDQAKLFQHLGKLKNKLIDKKEKRDFENVVTDLLDNMQTNWPEINRQPTEKEIQDLLMPETLRQKVEGNVQSFRTSLVKGEYFIRRMDKWEDLGPAWKQLYKPIYEAYGTEFVGLEKITAKLEEIFKPFTSKRGLVGRPWVDEIFEIEGVPQKLTKEQMIMVALNSGNPGNRATFTGGELQWTEAQIDAVVAKLSPEEMKFVEDIWKLFEEQLPALKDVYKQLNGIEMKTVEGKYFPIVLDQKLSWIADQRAAEENARNFFKSIYPTDAKVVSGSTIERVGTSKNVKLSFDVIFQKLSEVNHYTSHVLPVRDVVKVLKDERVRMAISTMPDDIGGPEVYKEMMKWIQDVAVERKEPLSKVEDWMSTIRNNTTIVALGLKFSVGLFQGLGATMTIEQLAGGTKAFTDAGYEFYKDRAGMIDQIKTMSTEMRARPHSWDRELQDAWGRLGLEHFKGSQRFKDFCFSMITLADMEVSYISWIAGFNEGMLKFKGNEADAVMFADSVVRKSQGVSMTKDLANIQKGSELKHMVTMFYTFFNSMENQMIERGLERKYGERSKFDIARTWWWIVVAPAVLGFMLNERRIPNSPGELAKEVAQYRLSAIPFVRDITSASLKGYDYQLSPVAKGGKVFSDTVKHGEGFISGEEEFGKFAGSAFEASGYAFGIPTGQALVTAQGIIDLNNGYTTDLTRLLFRAPKEEE